MIPVLVIDADPKRRTSLGEYLERTGLYRPILSETPGITINRSLAQSHAVIVAVTESGKEGLSLLRGLSEQGAVLPVIILAGSCDPAVMREAVVQGSDYVVIGGEDAQWHAVLAKILERVTGERALRDKVSALNTKLNLVGSVTRHDVLNQLTAVNGYNELMEMMVEDPQLKSFLEKSRMAIEKIRRQFAFAKDYQNMGTEPARWQMVSSIVRRAAEPVSLHDVRITETCGKAVIYADAFVDKAFTQILDNAVRHGGKVTEIKISCVPTENGAEIIIADDGAGIPADEKEKIFDRGFGKNTGWGLFLAKEILSLTGISIRETGEPGNGACFVLDIPRDAFRPEGEVTPVSV